MNFRLCFPVNKVYFKIINMGTSCYRICVSNTEVVFEPESSSKNMLNNKKITDYVESLDSQYSSLPSLPLPSLTDKDN